MDSSSEEWLPKEKEIRDGIVAALQHDDFLEGDLAREAAFHMTDWLKDLDELVCVYRSGFKNLEEAQSVIMGFLVHVPNHLAAASRIVMDLPVTDVFGIGAVEGDGIAKREPGMKPGPE